MAMGGMIAGIMKTFGGEPLMHAAVELGVSAEVAAQMDDLLSKSQLKMFEQLVVDLLSNNSLTVENKTRLKRLVNSTLDGILSNNTLQVIAGDSMLSTWFLADFVKGLMQKAQCGPLVAKDVQLCATNIHALMCMNVVVEACSDVMASLQGKLESAKGDESFGLVGTKADALKEIEKMTKSIDAIRQATDVRVDANARAARLTLKVEDAVVGLRKALEFDLRLNLFSQPDWLLSNCKKECRDEVIRTRCKEVGQLCRDLREFLNEIQDTGDELECRKITKQCSTMIKFLAFGPQLQEEHRKAMEEALKIEEQLKDELAESIRNLAKKEGDLAALQDQMQTQQQSFDLRLQIHNQKIDSQKALLRGLGQGTITVRGTPYDDLTKKYWQLWQTGKWAEVTEMGTYRSRRFSVIIDSDMTSEQKKGMALMEEYISELDQMKQNHQLKMTELLTAKGQCSAALYMDSEKKTKAEQRVKEAEQKHEPLWSMFAVSHPVEYSEVKMLYNTSKHVTKVAEWMFQGHISSGTLKMFVGQLEMLKSVEYFDHSFCLMLIKQIEELLTSQDLSPVAFLKSIGEHTLKRVLRPWIQADLDLEAPTRELQDFDKNQPIQVD